MAAEWEYRATFVTNDIAQLNETLGKWAEAGWELVTASTAAFEERAGNGSYSIGVQYTTFWRRPARR